jgi:hypothetical protein
MIEAFDRESIATKPLRERLNKLEIESVSVDVASYPVELTPEAVRDVELAADEIRSARKRGAPVILAFGAHSIKNGLSRVMVSLMEGGWVTHFATNGAGFIHDWEFAFQGRSGEDVRRYVAEGQFGIWEETGSLQNLALVIGAWRGMGYGEALGALAEEEGLSIPRDEELVAVLRVGSGLDATESEMLRAAAAADLRALLKRHPVPPGLLRISHPFKRYGLAAAAYRAHTPFTAHPMFGHDIIYTHPTSRGAPIGRTADLDFLRFAASVARLEGGVYLSVGSAVMSPMIFEKALSMARNSARSRAAAIENFSIHVIDLARSAWDWESKEEPPQDDPAYYLRFCKTFSRMGGRMTYTSADNRSWLVGLLRALA